MNHIFRVARSLWADPGFLFPAILTLGLACGATSSMFPLLDRLFVRNPDGVVRPNELRRIFAADPAEPGSYYPRLGAGVIDAARHELAGIAEVAARQNQATHTGEGAKGEMALQVSANYFHVLGVRIARGRAFSDEDAASSSPVAVVSDRYWHDQMDADPDLASHALDIAGRQYTVIGVASPGFSGIDLSRSDIWIPLPKASAGELVVRMWHPAAEKRMLAGLTVAFQRGLPRTRRSGQRLVAIAQRIMSNWAPGRLPASVGVAVQVAVVTLILALISIANVATLFLMRGLRRQHELAVQVALGLTPRHLYVQLASEGLVVGAAASVAAIVVATVGASIAQTMLTASYASHHSPFDARLLAFTLVTAACAGVVASLIPSTGVVRVDPLMSMRGEAYGGTRARSRLRAALLVGQVALSLVLLVGAGLFIASLRAINAVPLGMDTHELVTASATFQRPDSGASYLTPFDQEARFIAELPGVRFAAVSSMAPMQGELGGTLFFADGDTLLVRGAREVDGNAVGPGYFAATGMRLLEGRDFSANDRLGSRPVMIVNRATADAAWPGVPAVGRCLEVGQRGTPCVMIVGVVSDAHLVGVRSERSPGHYYLPVAQFRGLRALAITVRAPPEFHPEIVRRLRGDLPARLPASASLTVRTVDSALAPLYERWTVGATVLSSMGGLALVLAISGVYSLVGSVAKQSTRRIAIQSALGAPPSRLLGSVASTGLRLVGLGIVVGLVASWLLAKVVASQLYGVRPFDPLVVAAACALLVASSIVASLLPAGRACRADLITVLRI